MKKMQLRVCAVTYNVGTSKPGPEDGDLIARCASDRAEIVDIFCVGLQEVNAQPHRLIADATFGEPWTERMRTRLQIYDLVLLEETRLQGIVVSIFVRRSLLIRISNVETNYTRTGLMGLWGNKGAVSIRFDVCGTPVCFLNAHLSAHEHKIKSRIQDYQMIVRDQRFDHVKCKDIQSHKYVFWMGDLNFRLNESCNYSFKKIEELIRSQRWNQLEQYDELTNVLENDLAFQGFKEEFPSFAPTFKFKVGTTQYNSKRKPAWTDRILHKALPKADMDKFHIEMINGSYQSHVNFKSSDHQPVSSMFLIDIPSDSRLDSPRVERGATDRVLEDLVKFDAINAWLDDEENVIDFMINQGNQLCDEDWIGIYYEGFSSVNDYLSYEYLVNCKLVEVEGVSESIRKYRCKFAKLPIFGSLPQGNSQMFCVVYFKRDAKKWNIRGISNPFAIEMRHTHRYVNKFI